MRKAFHILLLAASLASGATPVLADLKLDDLNKIDTSAFAEPEWLVRKQTARLIVHCANCPAMTAIDVTLNRAEPGMEGRIRSGETTALTMLDICKENASNTQAECYGLKPVTVGEAVGFVSDVKIFEDTFAATITLYQDGQLLLMRAVGPNREEAGRLGGVALREIAPQIVR